MAKAQGKKTAAAKGKGAAKKVVAREKSAVRTSKKKVAPKKKTAAPARRAAKKPAPKPVKSAKSTKSTKPLKPGQFVKVVKKAAATVKAVKKAAQAAVKHAVAKVVPKPVKAPLKTKAVKPVAPPASLAPKVPAVPATRPVAGGEPEKKRGRRARPRIHSSGAPAAAWLSTEKPRPASFIPAPARAEAPSAIAAPPASSDRLIRPDDVGHPAVRTVPVRIDVEQSAGRYYVIANPMETTVRVGEGIEWDFRYLGGADVSVEEIVVEFDRPSPFSQLVYRTRKPGGARPHRQLSGGAVPSAAGKRIEYTVRAINPFKAELARTTIWVNVTA